MAAPTLAEPTAGRVAAPGAPGRRDRILVFIPVYNCERQIPRVIAQFTPDLLDLFETVAVIDNRSTDGTLEAARAALAEHLPRDRYCLLRNRQNNGLGGSHKVAFNLAIQHGYTHLVVLH